jgi:phosphoglucosamine mutase
MSTAKAKERIFGTDGIRGTANKYPMTAEIALKFGMAAGSMLKRSRYGNRVVIAKDTRLSGYLIEPALTAGLISVGADVILVGPMPTPAVPMLIKSLRADLGVMISASHNPYQDNGLKLFDCNGSKMSDEQEEQLSEIMASENLDRLLVEPDELGRAKRLDDAPGRYIEYIKNVFPSRLSLNGLRIVADCANGAAYKIAPTILWELGAEVIPLACEPDGFNINHNCGSLHTEALATKVKEVRADIGIALDGDADRAVICNEEGKIIAGDHLIGMIANHLHTNNLLKGDGVVVTQMSNAGLEKYISTLGLKTYRTKVGDRYVCQKMVETGCNFGAEQSGHVILGDHATTGDGIITSLYVLATMIDQGQKLSKLEQLFDLYPQVTKSFNFNGTDPLEIEAVKIELEKIYKQYNEDRILVRKSGTEKKIRIMVEGRNEERIHAICAEIEDLIMTDERR